MDYIVGHATMASRRLRSAAYPMILRYFRSSLVSRMLGGVLLMLSLALAISLLALQALRRNSRATAALVQESREDEVVSTCEAAFIKVQMAFQGHSVATAEYNRLVSQALATADAAVRGLATTDFDENSERTMRRDVTEEWTIARALGIRIAAASGDSVELWKDIDQFGLLMGRSLDKIERTGVAQRLDLREQQRQAIRDSGRAEMVMATAFVFGLFAVAAIAAGMGFSIIVPLRRLRETVRTLSQGDLSCRVKVAPGQVDELGELGLTLNEMAERLEVSQAALREAHHNLEERVVERTHKLEEANGELRKARDEADRANHAKSEFLSRMSHELRTPLNSILGFGQLLELDPLSNDQADSVKLIMRGGHHLLKLINEVLDISCIEAGRVALSMEPVCLNTLVAEAAGLVAPTASAHTVSILDDLVSFEPVFVFADAHRLKQVLLNLLSNAIKYNRPGGKVTVSARRHGPAHDERAMIEISVTDTGWGIREENLGRLFVPFDRLDAEKRNIEGTGLGLTLSKRLVEVMGGRMTVSSVAGHGSIFSIYLQTGGKPTPIIGDLSILNAPNPLLQGDTRFTVVYIEDNLSNLKLIQRFLERVPNLHLIPAMQGSLGLDLVREHQPDLVLLDLNLPDMHGADVLESLRRDERTSTIPVVVISADATQRQIDRLMAGGARVPGQAHRYGRIRPNAPRPTIKHRCGGS